MRNTLMCRTLILLLSLMLSPTHPTLAQDKSQAQQIPWQSRLGLRVKLLDDAFPLIDRVTLVPDTATYVDEIAKWSPAGRWPVLFEDDHFASMFIRRFKPAEILRRESVGKLPNDDQELRTRCEHAIIRAFGGDPESSTLRETFEASRYQPPGVVIASPRDPAWTAALALAAGHGQPLAWISESFGNVNRTLEPEATETLRNTVDRLVADQGYMFSQLGDAIDAITLCFAMPHSANADLSISARPEIPPDMKGGAYATTDLIGRLPGGERYAITGWIFGDETRSAYIAMCSLFLPRERISLWHTYPFGGEWDTYAPNDAAPALMKRGYDPDAVSGDQMSQMPWLRSLMGGANADVIVMTTRGGGSYFDLYKGRGYAQDVPVLNVPAALYLVHSWSMQTPGNRSNVGGRWLEHGVYAYVGAVEEPRLGAFVPPIALAERWVNYVPFLMAARHFDPHPLALPWKVNTFGDPLMLCAPPDDVRRARIAHSADYGTNLISRVRDLIAQCKNEDADDEDFQDAIRTLALIGRDDVAADLWLIASKRSEMPRAAEAALGSLFRMRREDQFLDAWMQAANRDDLHTDMLWHLITPRLAGISDERALMQLQVAVREPIAWIDLERLAPQLAAVFGNAHVQSVVTAALQKTSNPHRKKKLEALLAQYQ